MLALTKYTAVFSLSLRQAFALPLRTLANAILMGVRLFFLCIIYTYTYAHTGASSIMPLASVLAALSLYNVLLAVNLRRVFDTITKDIKSGMFEVSYLRPMSYLLHVAFERLGMTTIFVLSSGGVALILLFFFSPGLPPTLSLDSVLWGLLLAALGVALSGFVYTLIALPALWINDAEPFYYITDKTVLILGGAYVPVALFPEWLKTIAEYSPFGAIMSATRMFDVHFLSNAPYLALIQAVWILILWGVVSFVFRLARAHISINGG